MNLLTDRTPVATLANLGAAFTEETRLVWCPWAEQEASTNFDGATHFCQFCGRTDHEPVGNYS
jgi:hypothetical protein